MAGSFGRRVVTDIRVLVPENCVSGHFCPAFVGSERGRLVYTGPYFDFDDGHRDFGRGDTPEVPTDHALRVGVVLGRCEPSAVSAKKDEKQVRHGREAAEVLLGGGWALCPGISFIIAGTFWASARSR